jgi:hypothetical protein
MTNINKEYVININYVPWELKTIKFAFYDKFIVFHNKVIDFLIYIGLYRHPCTSCDIANCIIGNNFAFP